MGKFHAETMGNKVLEVTKSLLHVEEDEMQQIRHFVGDRTWLDQAAFNLLVEQLGLNLEEGDIFKKLVADDSQLLFSSAFVSFALMKKRFSVQNVMLAFRMIASDNHVLSKDHVRKSSLSEKHI